MSKLKQESNSSMNDGIKTGSSFSGKDISQLFCDQNTSSNHHQINQLSDQNDGHFIFQKVIKFSIIRK